MVNTLRKDHSLIASLVPEQSSALDIGCGDGELLQVLRETRQVRGYGLEIDGSKVSSAVAAGLSVVQGDADTDLRDYPDQAFGTVILSNSIQTFRRPDQAIEAAVRVGEQVIVSFPNFGHWKLRMHLLFSGTMPRSKTLPARWYATDNIHLCTVKDFLVFTKERGLKITAAFALNRGGRAQSFQADRPGFSNLFAEDALFVLSRP